jgi:tetratricopeptide (TPR) repeat protein
MKTLVSATLCVLFFVATTAAAQSESSTVKPYPWARLFGRCTEPGAAERMTGCKPPPDWPDLSQSIRNVNLLFVNLDGDYGLITRAENDLAFSTGRFDNGAYRADAWYYGLEELFLHGGDYGSTIVETWKSKLGDNGTVPLAQALVHYGDASTARGGGYASTVSPEAWRLYYAALARALDALDHASERLKGTPPYHDMRLSVLLSIRDRREAALDEFRQSIKRWPDYKRIYYTAGTMALPQWGGGFEVLDGVARSALEYNPPDEGALIYAWLYMQLIVLRGEYTMPDTEVDWTLMKRGIRVFTGRDSTNIPTLEMLAKSACQMQDRDEARRIYEIIDRRAKPMEGKPKVSDACRAYATEQ